MDNSEGQSVRVIIPVYNGGRILNDCLGALKNQKLSNMSVLVVDSGSTDGSHQLVGKHGYELLRIRKEEFDHGGTRQMAAEISSGYDIVVCLTQDAVLSGPESLFILISAFEDKEVAAAYGRQLPSKGASAIGTHARLFNYPPRSNKRTLVDKEYMSIKAAFISNSFAAYRTEALLQVGGFPSKLILGEDMVVAARILQARWSVAYVAEATVYHSHDYSVIQEFQRYFDIGVMHQDQRWLLDEFGKPEGEGKRFVISELNYLRKSAPHRIPEAIIRTFAKYAGYKMGQNHAVFPRRVRRLLSMHKGYWKR